MGRLSFLLVATLLAVLPACQQNCVEHAYNTGDAVQLRGIPSTKAVVVSQYCYYKSYDIRTWDWKIHTVNEYELERAK